MGHTKTCNFQAGLHYRDNPRCEVVTGCDTLKQATAWTSDSKILKVVLWAQTAYGKACMKGYDYLIVTNSGAIGMMVHE